MGSGNKRSREDTTAELRVSSYTKQPQVAVGSFFNGFTASEDTEFELYQKKHTEDEFIFHGENERLDYSGATLEEDSSGYAVAVYDPVSKSVDLYQAPVLLGSVSSKAHRKLKGPAVKQNNVRMNIQRNALGEAFGTKKAKKAISDLERNRIDSDKLADVEADIVDTVKASTTSLPTRDQLTETVLNDRPTPACDVDATNVEDIYPVYNIIPKRELTFIRVGSILNEEDIKKKVELLPYQNSPYITSQLSSINNESQTQKLQLIYYASLLIGVYQNRRISNKENLSTALNTPPDLLIDGILERFTILRPGQFGRSKDRGYTIDPHHEDKLLCYLLATILHINNFIVEISPLAQELSLKPSRLVGLFKALGCIVKSATVAEAEAFGIPKSIAASYKIASLKVPFKLPQMTRRGRKT
ncbi:DNA-directed RNA polymerase I subunit RPA49 [Wickerhamomyces ciferrii]|uniref:DNA-directed RNA polymerase I subunit RPA49 n=1 Tax=Wickerhamomyces ciferrii (strain ATCC 14091 / BCRC 22168 / CBS 111 / JCM 3599 / NBRC 0793 / NRRL Y-1031 F-60-10) TaxID=1206466 RepID=K0KJ62_WICCF|nr:DNA-directed RNA polymerase I subunit RPA49 [Wickerhamomyces ciferrii]CCH42172.1 DNA-directed RNA polymerase I subunit RPA49 [Wickerhamomyces ciferrii]